MASDSSLLPWDSLSNQTAAPLLLLWMAWLFLALGTAASDYFLVNLGTVCRLLHLPGDLAGVCTAPLNLRYILDVDIFKVTLIALGNTAGDLVSNLVAVQSTQQLELAMGDLLGSGLFLSCIIFGTMGILARQGTANADIKLNSRVFLRDVGFYALGLLMLLVIMILVPGGGSGNRWWLGLGPLILYACYVFTVVWMNNSSASGFRWFQCCGRRRQRISRSASSLEIRLPPESILPIIRIQGDNDEMISIHSEDIESGRNAMRQTMAARNDSSSNLKLVIPDRISRRSSRSSHLSSDNSSIVILSPVPSYLQPITATNDNQLRRRMPDGRPRSAGSTKSSPQSPSNEDQPKKDVHQNGNGLSETKPLELLGRSFSEGPTPSLRARAATPLPTSSENLLVHADFSLPRSRTATPNRQSAAEQLDAPVVHASTFHTRASSGAMGHSPLPASFVPEPNQEQYISENIVNLHVKESVDENVRLHSLTTAMELWGAWRRLTDNKHPQPDENAQNILQTADEQHVSTFSEAGERPIPLLDLASSPRPVASGGDGMSPREKRPDLNIDTQTIEEQLSDDTSEARPELSLFELNDRCPICFKCASVHPESDVAPRSTHRYSLFIQLRDHLFPLYSTWRIQGWFGRFLGILNAVPVFLFSLTIPTVSRFENDEAVDQQAHEHHQESVQLPNQDTSSTAIRENDESMVGKSISRTSCPYGYCIRVPWLHKSIAMVQVFLTPSLIFFALKLSPQSVVGDFQFWLLGIIIGAVFAALLGILNWDNQRVVRVSYTGVDKSGFCPDLSCDFCLLRRPLGREKWTTLFTLRYWKNAELLRLFSLLGFINGLFWIYILSREVVATLTAFGHILNLSDSILGITFLTFGNSIGDFVVNIMLAKMGFFAMATGACFGALILNLLITTGVSVTFLLPTGAVGSSKPFHGSLILIISYAVLVVVMICHCLILGYWKRFHLDRSYGLFLVGLWLTTMTVVIVLEAVL